MVLRTVRRFSYPLRWRLVESSNSPIFFSGRLQLSKYIIARRNIWLPIYSSSGPLNIRRNLKTAGVLSALATYHWATSDFWCAILSVARSYRSPCHLILQYSTSFSKQKHTNAYKIEALILPDFASTSATWVGKTSCLSTLWKLKLRPQRIMVSDGVEAFRVSEYPL